MDNQKKIQLGDILVGKIEGDFFIPSYQRGFRWDDMQVCALLDDIYNNGDAPYCLQPLVVRKVSQDKYEVIDGQQRLTTLFIIYKYMVNRWPDYIENVKFTLTYETREENVDFFSRIENEELAETNIDFHFIHKAYKTIEKWFALPRDKKPIHVAGKLTEYFDNNVKFIWYELQSANVKDAIELFTRLNIGRIPLTNAELIKALFLCRANQKEDLEKKLEEKRQLEISMQWDTIERELHDEDFWYFLTRKSANIYPTRIELLFDFIAGKQENERDMFHTFFWFNNQPDNLQYLWHKILKYYYRLKEWYKKDELYHKIGYLIASGYSTIDRLMEETKEKRKSVMNQILEQHIKDSINFNKPYELLSYDNDYDEISRLLLLFNVVSLMKNKSDMRFPFKEYNTNKWSLEHIHAQNSLKLNTQEKWRKWLEHHIKSVESMMENVDKASVGLLLQNIHDILKQDKITDVEFSELADRITHLLTKDDETTEYIHTLSNMALLQTSANSALSNGLFDAKRREIIKMDAEGLYIPYCTKMVFLKYYSSEKQNNVSFHFWGEEDRKAYISKMNEILKQYLKEEIKL